MRLFHFIYVYLSMLTLDFMVHAYRWNPDDNHPCNIPRIAHKNLPRKFRHGLVPALYPTPVVILHNNSTTRNALFLEITHRDRIADQFPPDFEVTLSSSNALSEHRRTILFQDYLRESWDLQETLPDRYANTSWYFFGDTYSREWQDGLLQYYELPPCSTCTLDSIALSFGIGNRCSGVQWHTHGPGFSQALHGRKHWILLPPDDVAPRNFHKDQSSRQWMEEEYANMKDELFECTLSPGDLLYFPDRWWHATINLDRYTAFVSTFTSEHDAVDDEL